MKFLFGDIPHFEIIKNDEKIMAWLEEKTIEFFTKEYDDSSELADYICSVACKLDNYIQFKLFVELFEEFIKKSE